MTQHADIEMTYKVMDAPVDLTELMERLVSSYTIGKAAEAFPMLVYIISQSLSQQTGSPIIMAKEVSERYGVSQPTVTHWNKRLKKHGLISYSRDKGGLRYTAVKYINPAEIFRNYIVDEIRDRSSAMFGDLFARIRALELQLCKDS